MLPGDIDGSHSQHGGSGPYRRWRGRGQRRTYSKNRIRTCSENKKELILRKNIFTPYVVSKGEHVIVQSKAISRNSHL